MSVGSWGEYPWESDGGLDVGWELLDETVELLARRLEQPLPSMPTSRDIDGVRACCDILVRLRPYVRPVDRRAMIENAVKQLELVLAWLAEQDEAAEYERELLASLREMLGDSV